jgi:hypothetical protein
MLDFELGSARMNIFQVPQREVEVEVLLEGGEKMAGLLYAPTSGPSGGPGRLSERLNDGDEHFLPLVCAGSAFLTSKACIMTVLLPRGEEEIESQESDQAIDRAVEMNLKGGLNLTGRLRYTMPPEKRRMLDYLNAAPQFILLLQDERSVLVNCSFVVRIRDLDGEG